MKTTRISQDRSEEPDGRELADAMWAPLDRPPQAPRERGEPTDGQSLYDEIFGPPALRQTRLGAFCSAYEEAHERPAIARAMRAGLDAGERDRRTLNACCERAEGGR